MSSQRFQDAIDRSREELRWAVRALLRRRSYALLTAATLALAIAAASSIVAVAYDVLLRPLPFPASERLARILAQPPGTTDVASRGPLHAVDYLRLRQQSSAFESIEALWAQQRVLTGEGEPTSLNAARASAGALPLLGSGAWLGRTWSEDEDAAGARLVVLSFGLWQRRFGGDPGAIGRTLVLDGEAHEVIGVMPRDFNALYVPSELWTPLHLRTGEEAHLPSPRATYLQAFGRLAAGAKIDLANEEISRTMAALAEERPETHGGWQLLAIDAREAQFGPLEPALHLLALAAAALLLLAAANLGNLGLAAAWSRRTDYALRASLGAARGDLVRTHAVECALLGLVGGSAGALLSIWLLPTLVALDPGTASQLGEVSVGPTLLAIMIVVATAVMIGAGLAPLHQVLRDRTSQSLAEDRRAIGSPATQRFRTLLLGVETALSVVLLAGGAQLTSGFLRATRVDPGFDPENLLGGQLRLPASRYSSDASRVTFVDEVLARVRAIPGVVEAGTTLNPFLPQFSFQTLVEIEGRPTADGEPHTVLFRRVSPGYFRAAGVQLLAGRDFDERDVGGTLPAAIVSEEFATSMWPGDDPVGRRLLRNGRMWTVVGVVAGVRDVTLARAPEPTLYLPFAQDSPPGTLTTASLVVRTAGDPQLAIAAVRRAVLSIDPDQPIDDLKPLAGWQWASIGPERFRSALMTSFALLGLALAVVGMYGVTASAVAERTREVGVRRALGAGSGAIWRLLMSRAMRGVFGGLPVGALGALIGGGALRRSLEGMGDPEAWPVVAAVAALILSAWVAAAWPTWRALRVSPVEALRTE